MAKQKAKATLWSQELTLAILAHPLNWQSLRCSLPDAHTKENASFMFYGLQNISTSASAMWSRQGHNSHSLVLNEPDQGEHGWS